MNAWTARLENPVSAQLRDPATTGAVGIVLGAFAAFLAIPPIEARTVMWPILVGVVAAALGIWTVTRGRRRLGWGAVAAGLLGIGLGILATRSSSAISSPRAVTKKSFGTSGTRRSRCRPTRRARSTSARNSCSAAAITARPGTASRRIFRRTTRSVSARRNPAELLSTTHRPRRHRIDRHQCND